jgi:hypothetical protein
MGAGRRGVKRLAPLAVVVGMVALASPALAGGDRVRVSVPSYVQRNVAYSITLRGFVVGRARLYLFVDYRRCGPNPAVEHARANGTIWSVVHGRFKVVDRGWLAHLRGIDHACGYLQRLSEPRNAAGGILARGSVAYRVH